MKRMWPWRRSCAAITLLLAVAGCVGIRHADRPLHLVIDAGSTGTRFCLFAIERDGEGRCRAPHRDAPVAAGSGAASSTAQPGSCFAVRSPSSNRGLADLDPNVAADLVAAGLAQIARGDAARIGGAVLLGTGGFRRRPEPEQRAVLDVLRARFAVAAPVAPPIALDRIEVLSGAMEGVLAWRAARELGAAEPFAIVEIGGATVQYATAQAATSAPIGLTAATGALVRAGRAADCRVDDDRGPGFARCRAALAATVLSDARTQLRPAAGAPPPLFGLGAPWSATFTITASESLTRAEIDALGEKACPLGAGAARAIALDHWSPRLACLLFAYQSALLESLGADAIRRTGESWPRGAAVAAEFFPACSASTARR